MVIRSNFFVPVAELIIKKDELKATMQELGIEEMTEEDYNNYLEQLK